MSRILDILMRNNLRFPENVVKLTVSYCKTGAGNAGARHFVKEQFPAFRWNNPKVTFAWEKFVFADGSDRKAAVQIEFADGQTEAIPVHGLRAEEILQKTGEALAK